MAILEHSDAPDASSKTFKREDLFSEPYHSGVIGRLRKVGFVIASLTSSTRRRVETLDENALRDIGLIDGRATRQKLRDQGGSRYFP
jgi:hypothetical protein